MGILDVVLPGIVSARPTSLRQYGAALLIVALALLAHAVVSQGVPLGTPYLFVLPAVMFGSVLFGGRAGVLAGMVGVWASENWFRPTPESIQAYLDDCSSAILVCLSAFYFGCVGKRLRAAQGRAQADAAAAREAETALREHEQRLSLSTEAAQLGIFEWDATADRIIWENDRMYEIFGRTREDGPISRGELLSRVIHPDDANRFLQEMERAMQPERTLQVACRIRRKDGALRWVEFAGRFQLACDGSQFRLLGVARDVTRRKEAEAAVRETERQLRGALRAGRVLAFEWNTLSDQVVRLGSAADFFGSAGFQTSTSQEFFERVHAEDRPRLARAISGLRRNNSFYTEQYRLVRSDGSVLWVEDSGEGEFDAADRLVRLCGLMVDISVRKAAEQERERSRQAAEAANAAKDQFMAMLSHELRTPLTPVLMLSQALQRDGRIPEDVREDALTIWQNIRLEARLIDDLLDLTRSARGKLHLRLETADAHELLRQAAMVCRDQQFREKRLLLEWDLSASRSAVRVDSARIEQVFWNLIRNAIKFTPGGGRIRIRTINPDQNTVEIQISDTGVGIEPDALAIIFSPFEQGGSETTRRYGGLGLGLAIAKAIVDSHGGVIEAHSEGRDRGATLRVLLPLARLESPARNADPEADPRPGSRSDRQDSAVSPASAELSRSPRILLVEDHESSAQVLERLMRHWGWDVARAASVRSALETASSGTFDVVISDLGLPDGSGHDLMQQLRDRYGLCGIALSGYGMDQDIRKSLASGFFLHLTKPLDFEELRRATIDFLRTRIGENGGEPPHADGASASSAA